MERHRKRVWRAVNLLYDIYDHVGVFIVPKKEAVIRADDTVTFINVFDVEPSKQQELINVLNEGVEKVIRKRPGFISVSILASKDGTRVVNYAQWRSLDDIKATREDPSAAPYAQKSAELAKATPHVYSVASIHS
ncbi:antibiotic biosynthesis monooxygenase family protein [Dyella tabacisoli]|uniref:Antibiotic biosynthesis monooxygenase n=1 Tax=Dyella tabacisoli TaxID=2282381 RepID=A0A369UJS4_9GAMM|nr:antibiotic biosynthesis monooxygenase [Dyella tabacisoli]RDD79830.1 antibiotic biosynthesis monooxygenase [Dyella tabacisoli]